VYALAGATADAGRLRGVAHERLETVRVGRFTAVIGRLRAVPYPTDAVVRRYDRVMRELWRRTPAIVPVRFGTTARDLDDLVAMVRDRDRVVQRRLTLVRNRAQMTVRLLAPEAAGTSPAPRPARYRGRTGTDYLRARQQEQSVPALAPLRSAVRRWTREERIEKRGRIASVYHLVPKASTGPYKAALERAARDAGVRVIVSGPFPPYAFADVW
jgi:hypothetical protein